MDITRQEAGRSPQHPHQAPQQMSQKRTYRQALPGRAELRRHWLALRAKADAGDTLALGLVVLLAQGEGRRIAAAPSQPASMLLG